MYRLKTWIIRFHTLFLTKYLCLTSIYFSIWYRKSEGTVEKSTLYFDQTVKQHPEWKYQWQVYQECISGEAWSLDCGSWVQRWTGWANWRLQANSKKREWELSDGELKHFAETAAPCRDPPLQRCLAPSGLLRHVVVVTRQVKVVLDEPLEGRDLIESPPADLDLGRGGARVWAQVARVARLPRARRGLAALRGVRAAGTQRTWACLADDQDKWAFVEKLVRGRVEGKIRELPV